jgi:hypothetical protein
VRFPAALPQKIHRLFYVPEWLTRLRARVIRVIRFIRVVLAMYPDVFSLNSREKSFLKPGF